MGETQLDRIEKKIDDRLDKIEKVVYGNGHAGLCERMTIMETEHKDDRRTSNTVLAWVSVGIASVGGLFEFLKK